jgi:hypothetical protein
MRTAAGQIGSNTPFCIYSDVQMPGASKTHTLKPFLVVGAPASTIAPMLKDLRGSKTFTCHGLCSVEGGKISLVAKSGTVNYGLFKSQATIFKDLLGKEILIPAPGGAAAPKAEPAAKVETIDTPFGKFSYYSNDKSNDVRYYNEQVKRLVNNLKVAEDDAKGMDLAYQTWLKLAGKLPSDQEILKWAAKADRATRDEALQAKAQGLHLEQLREKLVEIIVDLKAAARGVRTATIALNAKNLEAEAEDLRTQAEQQEGPIGKALKFASTALNVAAKLASPDAMTKLEVATTLAETVASLYEVFNSSRLLERAKVCAEEAVRLEVDAAIRGLGEAEEHLTALAPRLDVTRDILKRAQELSDEIGDRAMEGFDRQNLPFKFENMEEVIEKIQESQQFARALIDGARQVFESTALMNGTLTSGKVWKVPKLDDDKKIFEKFKERAVHLGKRAGEVYKYANVRLPQFQKVFAEAKEKISKAHG